MEAYEIRLELLKMAKEILMEDWQCHRQALENVYYQKRDVAMSDGGTREIVTYPDLPPAVTSDNITELANKLNEFVSRRA